MTLNSSQLQALEESIHSVVNYKSHKITGGAGSGKTYTINSLQSEFSRIGLSSYCIAPTNSAANALGGCTVTRWLGKKASYDKKGRLFFSFPKNPPLFQPPPADVLIVDEAYMVNAPDIEAIQDAHGSRIIFVGDDGQLPPVGEGQSILSLLDISESKLEGSVRFDSLPELATCCYSVREASTKEEILSHLGKLPKVKKRQAFDETRVILNYSNAACNSLNLFYTDHHDLSFIFEGQVLLSDRTDLDLELYASEEVKVTKVMEDTLIIDDLHHYLLLTEEKSKHFRNLKTDLITRSKSEKINWYSAYYEEFEKYWNPFFYLFRTTHKAQGKTLGKCAINLEDMAKARVSFDTFKRLVYTAITRSNTDMRVLC